MERCGGHGERAEVAFPPAHRFLTLFVRNSSRSALHRHFDHSKRETRSLTAAAVREVAETSEQDQLTLGSSALP